MLCQDCSLQLKECVVKGHLTEAQLEAIIAETQRPGPHQHSVPVQSTEAIKSFNPITVVYYAGALLILAAFGWLMGSQWDALGPGGILLVSSLFALLFGYLGKLLYDRANFPVAGGLLISCCVGMVPLIAYSLQSLFGIWPGNNPGSYQNYYIWINGSWIIIELATIATALAAMRKIKFSFLVMPAAIALWFLSMDIAEIIYARHDLTFEMRSWVSIGVGLLTLVTGRAIEKESEGVDYAFWIYLAGLMSFWGGLTSLNSDSEFGKFIYCLINLGLIVLSLQLQRKTFAVFGVVGVNFYLGHLAFSLFKDSPLFPLALALLGVMIILSTVLFQKYYSVLRTHFFSGHP